MSIEHVAEPASPMPGLAVMWQHLGARYHPGFPEEIDIPVLDGWVLVTTFMSDVTDSLAYAVLSQVDGVGVNVATFFDKRALASFIPIYAEARSRDGLVWR